MSEFALSQSSQSSPSLRVPSLSEFALSEFALSQSSPSLRVRPFPGLKIILAIFKARQRRIAKGRAPTPSEVKARTSSTPQKKTPQEKTPQEKTPQEKMPQRSAPEKNLPPGDQEEQEARARRPGLLTHTLGSALLMPAGSDSAGRGRNTAQTALFGPSHKAQMNNCGTWVSS